MTFTSDCPSSDRPTSEELIEESIRQPHGYRQGFPENSDQSPVQQKMLQSSEPHKPRSKRPKPQGRKIPRSRPPEPKSNFSNEYSAIVSLGFTLIKYLFLFIVGFIIFYIFASITSSDTATILWNIGSMLIIPLVGLVFCTVAIVIFLESCR
jgi:hypothetical protein